MLSRVYLRHTPLSYATPPLRYATSRLAMISRVYLRHTPLGYVKLRVHTSLNFLVLLLQSLQRFTQDHEFPIPYSNREYLIISTLRNSPCPKICSMSGVQLKTNSLKKIKYLSKDRTSWPSDPWMGPHAMGITCFSDYTKQEDYHSFVPEHLNKDDIYLTSLSRSAIVGHRTILISGLLVPLLAQLYKVVGTIKDLTRPYWAQRDVRRKHKKERNDPAKILN